MPLLTWGTMTTHGELTADQLERFGKEFAVDPKSRLLQNALTRNEVDDIAMDRALAVSAGAVDVTPAR